MKLEVLGCSGAEFPGQRPTAFLLDGKLLLDAGTIGAVLPEERQKELRCVLVTHSHLDHVGALPFLADNLVLLDHRVQVAVASTPQILGTLRDCLLNNIIWPDFAAIPKLAPALRYMEMPPEEDFLWEDYAITPIPVNHSVPAVGFRITREGRTLLFTGDTGPTGRIWEVVPNPSVLLVEVSFPDSMTDLALITGHLTPGLLAAELRKLPEVPPRVLITHLKPQFTREIRREIEALGISGMGFVSDGDVYDI